MVYGTQITIVFMGFISHSNNYMGFMYSNNYSIHNYSIHMYSWGLIIHLVPQIQPIPSSNMSQSRRPVGLSGLQSRIPRGVGQLDRGQSPCGQNR